MLLINKNFLTAAKSFHLNFRLKRWHLQLTILLIPTCSQYRVMSRDSCDLTFHTEHQTLVVLASHLQEIYLHIIWDNPSSRLLTSNKSSRLISVQMFRNREQTIPVFMVTKEPPRYHHLTTQAWAPQGSLVMQEDQLHLIQTWHQYRNMHQYTDSQHRH